jgi:hypothetical protein
MSLRYKTGSKAARFAGQQLDVHTQPFAFRAPEEDDESVKISTMTPRRSSAPRASDDTAHRGTATLGCALTFSDDATIIAILPAPSEFSEGPALSDFVKRGQRLRLMPGETCPPPTGTSPSFSVTSAFLCVLCFKSFAFLRALGAENRQFLFNTNELLPNFATHTKQTTSFFPFAADKRLSRTSNLALHTKQITSSQITTLFLFNTNERSLTTTHQSPLTTHYSPFTKSRSTP